MVDVFVKKFYLIGGTGTYLDFKVQTRYRNKLPGSVYYNGGSKVIS